VSAWSHCGIRHRRPWSADAPPWASVWSTRCHSSVAWILSLWQMLLRHFQGLYVIHSLHHVLCSTVLSSWSMSSHFTHGRACCWSLETWCRPTYIHTYADASNYKCVQLSSQWHAIPTVAQLERCLCLYLEPLKKWTPLGGGGYRPML